MEKGANQVFTASLFYKPHSKLKPDFFGEQTSAWIIFPFEQCEMMKTLNKKWSSQGLDKQEIINRFEELKFDHRFISAALKNQV